MWVGRRCYFYGALNLTGDILGHRNAGLECDRFCVYMVWDWRMAKNVSDQISRLDRILDLAA